MIEDLRTHGQREIDAWKAAPVADLVGDIVGRYHLEARVERAGSLRALDVSLQGHLLLENRLLFRRVRQGQGGRPART